MTKKLIKSSMLLLVLSLLVIPLFVETMLTSASGSSSVLNNNSNRPHMEYVMETPQFTEASVHDPSVIKVDETFYVFGSHLASAKTNDFMNWSQVSTSVSESNPLFDNVFEELAEAFDWANTETLWAADVRQLEDGNFYMYYNASQGDAPRSALGLATAEKVEGPYENQGIFLKSGMWDEISPDGTIYDPTVHPNAIDPHTFYDKDGQLWMVYGSYSGGIFIFEMDNETGLPLEGQGYGTHLIGGNHSRIEGAFIEYNEETDYYYLYMTFGGLDAVGGYNMRVARSENPDGPYYDAEGNVMSDVKGAEGSFFDDRSIEPYGVKQMGNFLFERQLGEPGTGIGTGYVSPGHNSVYTDPETGQLFMFFHTRFPQRGEMHEIRVHQMFMNSEGWPVIAPYRYAEEELTKINRQDVIGDYKYINHGKEISEEIVRSEVITLEKNNKISGAVTGRWKATGHNTAELTIDGEVYDGVFLRQWDPTSEQVVMTFTALSEKGVAVWGSQMEDLDDNEVAQAVYDDLQVVDTAITDIELPTTGTRDTIISWDSSHPESISTKGIVNRPEPGEGDVEVELTATISKGQTTLIKTFSVSVTEKSEGRLAAYYSFNGDLSNSADTEFEAGVVTGDRINNEGGEITFAEGVISGQQAAYFDGQSGVRLPRGLITNHTYSVSMWLNPSEITQFTTTFFGARTENDWVSIVPSGPVNNETMVWSGSQAWYDAASGMQIPEKEWSHIVFSVEEGNANLYINNELVFQGENFPNIFTTADSAFALGVNYWDIPFNGFIDEVRIYDNIGLSRLVVEELYNHNMH